MLPEYDALIVRSATKVAAEVLAAGAKLRVVGRAGTGVDNIDVPAATQRGIIVVNAPAANSVAAAELAVSFICALSRHVPQASASMQQGRWDRSKYMGRQVTGKTLGLVGLGRIGAEVARRARGLEMHVLAYDPVVSTDRAAQLGVVLATLDEVISQSDFISVHVPLLDSTRHIINAERLAQMKPSAYLINAARGGVVDEQALYEALEQGQIAGAALDVYESEPPKDSPLVGHPLVITTPHLGASTVEAQAIAGVDVAEGVLTALAGGTPSYAVNAPFVPPEEWEVIAPYLKLGRQLGAICTGMVRGPIHGYEFEYRGEIASVATAAIRLAVLQGLLGSLTEQRVTPVNAPLLARARGIKYTEFTTEESESYTGLLVVRAITAEGKHEFAGSVIRDETHIVEVDGYWVDFIPTDALLLTYHRDRPGMIGTVGTVLGGADVNISGMFVGRLAPRDRAMMVLTLDEPVPAELLSKLEQQPDIHRAVGITL